MLTAVLIILALIVGIAIGPWLLMKMWARGWF